MTTADRPAPDADWLPSPLAGREQFASPAPAPAHADDEFTDPAVQRYARGPGAPLTTDEVRSAWTAAGQAGLTARALRPAG